jgi:exopolysaccharide biosynthesis polyprenyl glycosylphosphotransferase
MSFSADNQRNPNIVTVDPINDLPAGVDTPQLRFDVRPWWREAPFPFSRSFTNFIQKVRAGIERCHVSFSERRLLLMSIDTMLVLLSVMGGNLLWQFRADSSPFFQLHEYWYGIFFILVGWWILAALNDLYDVPSSCDRTATTLRLATVGLLTLFIHQLVVLFTPVSMPYWFFISMLALALLALWLWRLAYAGLSLLFASPQRVLIVGAGKCGQATAQLLQQSSPLNYRVLGYIDEAPTQPNRTLLGLPVLGQPRDLPQLVHKFAVDEVIVAANQDVSAELFQTLVGCLAQDVRVSSVSDLYERLRRYIPVHYIDPTWALYAVHDQPIFDRLRRFSKRILDLAVVLMALPILGLLFPALALAIRLDSPGPIFYRQMRSGRGGKPFSIYKFRTMVTDAEKDGKPRWAAANDPRITRVGRFLRKVRLDELPQMINILKGEMSIVGPRPERPEFVEELQKVVPFYHIRLMVKPGLTGWAQIHYDYGNSVEDALLKLQYDFYYIRYWSLWLDLYTMFKTIYVVLKLKGL